MSFTLPPIQPHTVARHQILKYHLNEWFPILGSSHKLLQYIDGFAGPGEYERGEPGSPIIALRAVWDHRQFDDFAKQRKTIKFLFVEKNREFYQHLSSKVDEITWPSPFEIQSKHGEFENVLTHLMDDVESNGLDMPPTLAFVDPFGSSGFSMNLLGRLASFQRVDVLINLNCLEFVRWILPDPTKHITGDRLYGGPRWRPAIKMPGHERLDFLVKEYEEALREIGWRGTSFEMVNRQNQLAYHLVFGTGSPKGMEAIKRAMRSVSPTGEFRYTDTIDPAQHVLLGMNMADEYPKVIGEHLFRKYEGQEVPFDQLVADEIDWHRWWLEPDLRAALRDLEHGDDTRIACVRNEDGRKRRKNSYPKGCLVTFERPPHPRLL